MLFRDTYSAPSVVELVVSHKHLTVAVDGAVVYQGCHENFFTVSDTFYLGRYMYMYVYVSYDALLYQVPD